DRGMFQWTEANHDQDQRQRMRRNGGFFVTASRFRAAELEYYVAELSAAMSQTSTHTAAGPYPAPIVHLHQPQNATPSWQDIAARDAQIRELRGMIEETKGKLQALETSAKREEQRLKSATDKLEAENGRLLADLKSKEQELATLAAKLEPNGANEDSAGSI